MANSQDQKPSTGLQFLIIAFGLLIVAAIGFGLMAFTSKNGTFAIASAMCLSSLLYGCIKILE